MTVRASKTEPTADQCRAALDSLFAPPGSSTADSSSVELVGNRGQTKKSEKPKETSFAELGKKGVSFGKVATARSDWVPMEKGVGTGKTANPEFNRSRSAKAALAHGGLLRMQKGQRGTYYPKFASFKEEHSKAGRTFDRKGFAHVSTSGGAEKPKAPAVREPLSYGVHAFDGKRPSGLEAAPMAVSLRYAVASHLYGLHATYDPIE